jgi:hypothetical protein
MPHIDVPANVRAMKIPEELQYLVMCFYQSSIEEHATVEEWISSTVRNFLSAEERKVVKQFLDDLLSAPHSDDELKRIWDSLDSDYWVEPGAGVRWFFTKIRDMSE